MNVAQIYLEMSEQHGVSKRKAISEICIACGRKLHSSYSSEWADETKPRPIPTWAVIEMQKRVAMYAAQKAGINASGEKVLQFVQMLAPKSEQ